MPELSEPPRIEDLVSKTERLATLALGIAKTHGELSKLILQKETMIRELRVHIGELESRRDEARQRLAHILHQLPEE